MRLSLLLVLLPLVACTPQPENSVGNDAVTNSIGEPAPAVTPTPTPAPTPAASVDNRSTARFRCIDGSRLSAAFDPDNGTVTVSRGGKKLATLKQQRTGSGISYAGHGYEFSGKGDDMDFSAPGQPPLPCTAIH